MLYQLKYHIYLYKYFILYTYISFHIYIYTPITSSSFTVGLRCTHAPPFVHLTVLNSSGRLVSLIPGSLIKFVPSSIRFSLQKGGQSGESWPLKMNSRPRCLLGRFWIDGILMIKKLEFCCYIIFFFFSNFQLKSLVWGYLMFFLDTLKWSKWFSIWSYFVLVIFHNWIQDPGLVSS